MPKLKFYCAAGVAGGLALLGLLQSLTQGYSEVEHVPVRQQSIPSTSSPPVAATASPKTVHDTWSPSLPDVVIPPAWSEAWASAAARPLPPPKIDGTPSTDAAWRGQIPEVQKASDQSTRSHPLYPAGVYYFYDDIANHSVFLLQQTLAIVEPDLPQHSLYVAPEEKTFGWSFPVKMNFIIKAIKANMGKVIVVLDTDLVFYRPWASLIPKRLEHYDILFQGVDSYNPAIPKELSKMKKTVTISVIVIQCNKNTLKLFEMVNSRITCKGRWIRGKIDQDELISSLSAATSQGLRWGILPNVFWGPSMSRSRCQMPPQPVMCHPDKKRGSEGGQWHPWHRKTEWKLHHVLSQHCMGKALIPASSRGSWWHPYSLTAGISTLLTPDSTPNPQTDVFIYSSFVPDDWSRFTLQVTLKRYQPNLKSQFVGGPLTTEHIAHVLQIRPAGSVTYFVSSTAVVFAPFTHLMDSLLRDKEVLSRGTVFFAVRTSDATRALFSSAGKRPVADIVSSSPRTHHLNPQQVHLTSDALRSDQASLLCVGDTLRGYSFPRWNTSNGPKGYLTDDERYFWLLAYTQCGRPYSDPFHSHDYWTPPAGDPVTSCKR